MTETKAPAEEVFSADEVLRELAAITRLCRERQNSLPADRRAHRAVAAAVAIGMLWARWRRALPEADRARVEKIVDDLLTRTEPPAAPTRGEDA